MFVNEAPTTRNFSIPDEALKTLPETIALLELRLSVEVEAAGLCAERRTETEAVELRSLMEQVDAQHEDPTAVQIHYDYDFHLAIAKAARNKFILAFLSYLRPIIVPRFRLGYVVAHRLKDTYYERIHKEHNAIMDAIEKHNGLAARKAMRKHLHNSLERVRHLALSSGVASTDTDQTEAASTLLADLKRAIPLDDGPEL
jgi:GntR family transcriptional repressor for pyruvate dehydrogenase complex